MPPVTHGSLSSRLTVLARTSVWHSKLCSCLGLLVTVSRFIQREQHNLYNGNVYISISKGVSVERLAAAKLQGDIIVAFRGYSGWGKSRDQMNTALKILQQDDFSHAFTILST